MNDRANGVAGGARNKMQTILELCWKVRAIGRDREYHWFRLVLVLSLTRVGQVVPAYHTRSFYPPNWAESRPLSMLIRKVKFGWLAIW